MSPKLKQSSQAEPSAAQGGTAAGLEMSSDTFLAFLLSKQQSFQQEFGLWGLEGRED